MCVCKIIYLCVVHTHTTLKVVCIYCAYSQECVHLFYMSCVRIVFICVCLAFSLLFFLLILTVQLTRTSNATVDQFCFNPQVRLCPSSTWVSRKTILTTDISNGTEKVPILCVMKRNAVKPPPGPPKFNYSPKVTYQSVWPHDDKGFLVCCDCTDGCLVCVPLGLATLHVILPLALVCFVTATDDVLLLPSFDHKVLSTSVVYICCLCSVQSANLADLQIGWPICQLVDWPANLIALHNLQILQKPV